MISVVRVTSVSVRSVGVGATSASVVRVTSVVRVGRRMIVVVQFVRRYVESPPPRAPPVTVVFPTVLRVVPSVVRVGRVRCRRWRLLVSRERLLPVLLAIAVVVVIVVVVIVVAAVVVIQVQC
jgi:hypothetical protein